MTTTQTNNQPPILTVSFGAIKGKIWQQTGKHGHYYSAQIIKTYRTDSGSFGNTNSFGMDELLVVAKVADKLHTEINTLMKVEKALRKQKGEDSADIQDEESVETENA